MVDFLWRWWPQMAVAVFVLSFSTLAWTSVRHINTLWDEANDHQVAISLLERPLVGSAIDGTQARLPMYVTAGAYAIFGPSIGVARAVSIIMGAAAIVLTFVAGRRWFGTGTAVLAAGLLAIAPFFLTFARTGLTEGDAFCPAIILLMFVAFDRYLQRRDSVRLFWFAASLGLAVAAKFYALFFLPALMLCDALERRRRVERDAREVPIRLVDAHRITGRGMLVWALACLGLEMIAAGMAQMGMLGPAVIFWAGGLALLLAGVLDQAFIAPAARRTARRLMRWDTPTGWLVVLPLAATVCLAICPAHVLNPEVLRSLIRSVVRPVAPEAMVRFVDPARLYLGIILLKLGPLLGVLTLVAMIWACRRRDHAGLSLVCTSTLGYILFLLVLPIRQAFYLMSVYPLLLLMLAALITHVVRWLRPRERLASAWVALVATGCLYLLWGTLWSYPEFGYYGYTLVGDEWLGAESRGYRNLVQVTNDGTEDALHWLAANVPPGRRVVSYLWDDHVIEAFVARTPLLFHLVPRHAYHARQSPPDIEDAHYVVVGFNNEASYHDLPSRDEMDARFDLQPHHVVRRGNRECQINVVQVFGRKSCGSAPAPAAAR